MLSWRDQISWLFFTCPFLTPLHNNCPAADVCSDQPTSLNSGQKVIQDFTFLHF